MRYRVNTVAAADDRRSARSRLRPRPATPLGLGPSDLSDLVVTSETTSAQTGVTHVYVRQRFRGIEIVGADITVSIARDGSITHQAASLVRHVAAAANRPGSTLTKRDAVTRAATLANVSLAEGERQTRPAKLVYQPIGTGKLRLAWQVHIETVDGEHQWVMTIDAVSGALLDKFDRVVSSDEHNPFTDTATCHGARRYNSGDDHLAGGAVSPLSGVARVRSRARSAAGRDHDRA